MLFLFFLAQVIDLKANQLINDNFQKSINVIAVSGILLLSKTHKNLFLFFNFILTKELHRIEQRLSAVKRERTER